MLNRRCYLCLTHYHKEMKMHMNPKWHCITLLVIVLPGLDCVSGLPIPPPPEIPPEDTNPPTIPLEANDTKYYVMKEKSAANFSPNYSPALTGRCTNGNLIIAGYKYSSDAGVTWSSSTGE